ncbi:type I restriction enzyme, S subunit [Nitrosomonas cryotolerans]|uniref:Type I restriction enzyme, S subunit n=1 Tax=Nitrosomonas cryotolerans ATCC 49181 TaxID=1131553 RepID=A0A1N6GAP2_9PROT|nr:restriction endonuclease subunit S [Nitrosomonas cryotolerans]SFQ06121.1 type I restriction enzyme, S subunit [Nitrosomonas cryotolerans]SIO04593.1 type I restriction enzyme, S subunit [Nitrosomonas cryotolerans ATCC 49181]
MNALIEKIIDGLKLDRSEWKLVKFGDVAIQQKDSVDRENSELTRYVKGEHMYSEDLHLREWGELADEYLGPAFIRKFEEDDILYGSRRTYLRKVVIAPFDGITSNTTFVIKANEKKIDKRLLPFVMMSEGFAQHSIRNSKGSVNPYVNWKDLSGYEFLLPPKDQQAQLAKLFWSVDNVLQKNINAFRKAIITKQVCFDSGVASSSGKEYVLSKILMPKKSKSLAPHSRSKYIGLEHIESGSFSCTEYGESKDALAQCNLVDSGDLCYSKLRPYLDKAFIADFDAVSTTELLVYGTTLASKKYILYHLHSKPFINFVTGQGFGTKMPRVSHKIIGEYVVKVLDDEKSLLDEMTEYENIEKAFSEKIKSTKILITSLINQVF